VFNSLSLNTANTENDMSGAGKRDFVFQFAQQEFLGIAWNVSISVTVVNFPNDDMYKISFD